MAAGSGLRGYLAIATSALVLLLVGASADASAAVTLCTTGSGAGECRAPEGIATDAATDRAFVADSLNHRIAAFDPGGTFLFAIGWGVVDGSAAPQKCTTATGCREGLAGSGAGQFNRPTRIAVDSGAGLIYVFDSGSFRVQVFDLAGNFVRQFGQQGTGECEFDNTGRPIAVGPSGSVYVSEANRVQKFSSTGTCEGEVEAGTFGIRRFAVDAAGNIFAIQASTFNRYDGSGALICAQDEPSSIAEATGVAVDQSGTPFVVHRVEAAHRPVLYSAIAEYGASCEAVRRFSYEKMLSGPFAPITSLAVSSSSEGDVYVGQNFEGSAEGSRVKYISFPPAGPVALAEGVEAPAATTSNTKALLRGEINPEGKATQYHFEYLTEEEWEAQGESFAGPATRSSPTQELAATDFVLHTVEAQIGCNDPLNEPLESCLVPTTTYRYRLVATNADGGGEGTAEGTPFESREALEIAATFATAVGTETATLNAEVNPLGIPSTGYFEYVDDAAYQRSLANGGDGFDEAARAPAAGELDFGAGEDPVVRSATVSLPAGSTFHYRVSLTNLLLDGGRVEGPARFLRTFVPPTVESCPGNQVFRTGFSALLADCRAYEMVSPLEKESGDVIPLGEFTTALPGGLSQSSVSGSKLAYGSYRAFGDAQSAPYTSQYVAERGELGWQSHSITGPRGHLNTELGRSLDTELKALSSDLCEGWLRTVAEPPLAPGAVPGYVNLYRRHDGGSCGAMSYEALTTEAPAHKPPVGDLDLELQGLSADGTVSIYTANDNYPGTNAPQNTNDRQQLYRRGPAGISYVCILPGEVPSTASCSAGTAFDNNGRSENRGASVDNAISSDGQRVFWTNYKTPSEGPGQIYVRIAGAQTVAVSKEGEEESGTTSSVFLKASADGSKALFLTGDDLYEFEVDGKTTTLLAGEAAGILGAGEDLSRIYLVSAEALAGANGEGRSPQAGEPNLYLDEAGQLTFVATLAEEDARAIPPKGALSPVTPLPFKRSSRISADGLFAIFGSLGSPTGYDNADASSGRAAAEVYRYDAAAEELDCVSCSPTNARPAGSDLSARVRAPGAFWAAGWIFGWQNTMYASRNLSADGSRVFFESSDALSPRDTNGVADVYEWEKPGTGSCSESSSSHSPLNGGCLNLISSGQSVRIAEFNDASPTGDDVFFSTLASLVSQDYGLVDVYDARVGGGLPAPPLPPSECEAGACQDPAPAPKVQTPASLDFHGPGKVKPKPKRCAKGKVRRKGRCVARKHGAGKRKHKQSKGAKKGRAER